jgi:uncharacterized glyoxalase superfamily protein PhnB
MKFKYTILYVEDVKKTLDFYVHAFGLNVSFLHESDDYGELDTGDTKLSFSSIKLMEQLGKNPSKADASSPSFEIAFETDDVAKALERAIESGAQLVQSVEHMPWGQTTAYVSDINGALVEICTPVSS